MNERTISVWNTFTFFHGGNPYITKTDEEFLRMLRKYEVEQMAAHIFYVKNERTKVKKSYSNEKTLIRDFAMLWKDNIVNIDYKYSEMCEWKMFFEKVGKKYGLIKEFRKQYIC